MKNNLLKGENKTEKLFLILGVFLRIIIFVVNLFVGGHNCDEVMTSLNAFSLADRMTDINGEKLPVYFDNWVIGGQSPFATYLTALSVKIFGNNLFAVRLPALIFSILGFIAFYFFVKEIFKDSRHILACTGLAAICPWMLFSGAFVLDCNYLAHIMAFAMLFLAKGINSKKTTYYILSSVFFSLCFYCYVASVFLIPFVLISIYAILIIKKKISIKNTVISVISVCVVAVPFILWGLVVTGKINEFSLLGFNFSIMPKYARAKDTVFASGGAIEIISNLAMNLIMSFVLLLINDWSIMSVGSSVFGYGFLLSGIILVFGFIKLLFTVLKKDNELKFNTKVFSAGAVTGILTFCAFVNEPHLGSLYRYGILSYLLVFIEAIGLAEIGRILKKVNFKKLCCIYLALSLIMFSGVFAFVYVPQVKIGSDTALEQEYYGDPFFDCLDFAKENGYENAVIYKSKYMLNTAVYARYYCYGDKAFYSIENEIKKENQKKDKYGNYLITEDGSITYCRIEENNKVQNDFCIAETVNLEKLSFDKNIYKTKQFGFWTVIYK